jgi:hypothetical protein
VFAHDTFVALFGAVRPGELDVLPGLVRAALREGYAIVLNEPGTKKPLCTLTAAGRKQADRQAQDDAAERGEPNAASRRHPCGIAHALTEADATKVTGLLTRVTKTYGASPNIGLEPGASRLIAVDMDTADQRDAFLSVWEREDPGAAPGADVLYTVRSPGQKAPDGSWAHSEGGHTWFTLPAGVRLPTTHDAGRGVLTDDGGWSLIWSGLQVLVPPSVRAEGPYACVGMPRPAPAWMLQRIEAEVLLREERERLRLERRAAREQTGDLDPVDAWAAGTTWAELLEPRGWSATGRVDTCSCPTWTAPGPHGSPKSATAHDEGCAVFDTADGHAPMHIWTDNPPDYLVAAVRDGHRTLTKLTHEAYADHEGDESAAVIGLGLATSVDGQTVEDRLELEEFAHLIHEESTNSPQAGDSERPGPSEEGPASDDFESADDQLAKVDSEPTEDVNPDTTGEVNEDTPGPWFDRNELEGIRPPDAIIAGGVLDHGTMVVLAGKYGTYKTFLALDWAASIASGVPWAGFAVPAALPVVYIAAEGAGSFHRRLCAWEEDRLDGGRVAPGMLTIRGGPVNVGKNEDMSDVVRVIREKNAKVLVVDTLSRCAPGLEENEASKVAAALERLFMIRDALQVTVVVLHHTGHQGLRARGSSVLEDNADASWVIRLNGDGAGEDRGPEVPRTLMHRKIKDGEILADRPLTLKQAVGSAYLSYDVFEATGGPTHTEAAQRAAELADMVSEIRSKVSQREAGTLRGETPRGHRRIVAREAYAWLKGSGKTMIDKARQEYLDSVEQTFETKSDQLSPSDLERGTSPGDTGTLGDGDTGDSG